MFENLESVFSSNLLVEFPICFTAMDQTRRGFKILELGLKSDFSTFDHNKSNSKSSTPMQCTSDVDENKPSANQPEVENEIRAEVQNLIKECRLTEEMFIQEHSFESGIEISTSFVNNIIGNFDHVEVNLDQEILFPEEGNLPNVSKNLPGCHPRETNLLPETHQTNAEPVTNKNNVSDVSTDGISELQEKIPEGNENGDKIGITSANTSVNQQIVSKGNSEKASISEKQSEKSLRPNLEQSYETIEVVEEESSDDLSEINIPDEESSDDMSEINKPKRKKRRFSDPKDWKYNDIKKKPRTRTKLQGKNWK